MTPEGKVKKLVSSYLSDVKERLDTLGLELYTNKPVPTGYGKRNSLDFHLCLVGLFVAIETKAERERLTPLQRQTARSIIRSGGHVFIVSGEEGLNAFKRFVEKTLQDFVARQR